MRFMLNQCELKNNISAVNGFDKDWKKRLASFAICNMHMLIVIMLLKVKHII